MAKNNRLGLSACIGETIVGSKYPVFYDPHYCILNNMSPVTLVTGSPGTGKTFFGLVLASHCSIMGKLSFIIDPKGDFISLKLMEKMGEINSVQIWSVIEVNGDVKEENIGMLDPTSFTGNIHEDAALTLDVIKTLIGSITDTQNTELVPIVRDVVESPQPSFTAVVQKLLKNRDDEIRTLGFSLDTLLKLPSAKLLTSNKRIKKRELKFNSGTVVASIMGLDLPKDASDPAKYSAKEKISVAIIGLLTMSVLNIMRGLPKSIFKTLIVDEAWALMATKAGKDLISQTSLLGRSLNMATILMTQSPQHIETEDGPDLDTTISTRFAFGNPGETDNIITVRGMRLPEGEGWESLIPALEVGECLMQNSNGTRSVIHIMAQDNWKNIFDTNPLSVIEGR